jgi:BRCA1-associated protein
MCECELLFRVVSSADWLAREAQFSSLEPELVCRLVFVKEVEFLSIDGTSVPAPPAGQTELPTCPVCLERLDEHISGIVTTVQI